MNFPPPNANGSGGAVLTLVRLLASGKTHTPEAEFEEAHYSDWAPKKAGLPRALRQNNPVVTGPPSVIFVRDGVEVSAPQRGRTNLALALFSVALLIYAIPTAFELFAVQHLSPWVATILPGDLAGCVWLATVSRMRVLGLLLYIFLTASESGLYLFNLVDAGTMPWLTDLVPALFVAGVMTARSKRCYA